MNYEIPTWFVTFTEIPVFTIDNNVEYEYVEYVDYDETEW